MPENHRKTIAPSRFPCEQEALSFVFERFPAQNNYLAWSNFEFVAEDGSINEMDLLVVCSQGACLTEIKSRPGTVSGDQSVWTSEHEGKKHTQDNPVLLANRKCKRLKSLLARQRVFRNVAVPYIEPLVSLSNPEVRCQLQGSVTNSVCLRDVEAQENRPSRAGIMAAVRRRESQDLKSFGFPPLIRAFAHPTNISIVNTKTSRIPSPSHCSRSALLKAYAPILRASAPGTTGQPSSRYVTSPPLTVDAFVAPHEDYAQLRPRRNTPGHQIRCTGHPDPAERAHNRFQPELRWFGASSEAPKPKPCASSA